MGLYLAIHSISLYVSEIRLSRYVRQSKGGSVFFCWIDMVECVQRSVSGEPVTVPEVSWIPTTDILRDGLESHVDQVQHKKGYRGRPLSEEERARNKEIAIHAGKIYEGVRIHGARAS